MLYKFIYRLLFTIAILKKQEKPNLFKIKNLALLS